MQKTVAQFDNDGLVSRVADAWPDESWLGESNLAGGSAKTA